MKSNLTNQEKQTVVEAINPYCSGSPTKGVTLKNELDHLIKVIKETKEGKRNSDWFNREY